MLWAIPVFLVAFIQGYIATIEVYFISQVRPLKAAWWDLLNGTLKWAVIALFVIIEESRLPILIAEILGSALSTYVSLKRVNR